MFIYVFAVSTAKAASKCDLQKELNISSPLRTKRRVCTSGVVDNIMIGNANISSENLSHTGPYSNEKSSQENCAIPSQVTITIHVVTLLVSLVGNVLLIAAYVRMKEIIMLLIANMAASDLLVAIFLLPRLITREVTGSIAYLVHGSGGTFLCKMSTFLSDISLSVSTQSLILIAVERFLAIVYPILYKNMITVKRRYFLVASTWIVSMAIHSPYLYTFRLTVHNGTVTCGPSWEPDFDQESTQRLYELFLFIVVLILPLLIIFVLYSIVYVKLRRDKIASSRTEKGAIRHQERSRNLQRMAAVTVTSFLICWALYIVINVFKRFSQTPRDGHKCSIKVVDHLSRILAGCYSAVNPCICFIFVQSFFRELRAMCRRKAQRSAMRDDKRLRSSTRSNSCRIELQQSCSESAQTLNSLLITRNGNIHSISK